MKKYLIALIPFVVCTVLCFALSTSEPKPYPDPLYPYRNEAALDCLSSMWFVIGIIVSGMAISVLLIEDMFSGISRLFKKRREK